MTGNRGRQGHTGRPTRPPHPRPDPHPAPPPPIERPPYPEPTPEPELPAAALLWLRASTGVAAGARRVIDRDQGTRVRLERIFCQCLSRACC